MIDDLRECSPARALRTATARGDRMILRSPVIRRLGRALALAGLAAIFAAGCVVRERDGYDGSYRSDRYDRRDDGRYDRGNDRRDERRDDDRRDDGRRDEERRY
jgi:hypothetical protein